MEIKYTSGEEKKPVTVYLDSIIFLAASAYFTRSFLAAEWRFGLYSLPKAKQKEGEGKMRILQFMQIAMVRNWE